MHDNQRVACLVKWPCFPALFSTVYIRLTVRDILVGNVPGGFGSLK